MRILSSGLLLGMGALSVSYGVISRPDAASINGPIIAGLSLMSLGLFALRVNKELNQARSNLSRTPRPGQTHSRPQPYEPAE